MISTVLVNLGPWADLVLGALAVGILVGGFLLARRGARGRRIAGVLALPTTAAALALTLAPESGATSRDAFCFVGVEGSLFGDTANTAMLFPTAFLAAVATRAPLPVLAATSGLSALIELVQGAATALNRSCDLSDWVTNTGGAVVGALLAWAVLLVVRRLDPGDFGVRSVEAERVEAVARPR